MNTEHSYKINELEHTRIIKIQCFLIKIRENYPYNTTLARKLRENKTYHEFCGFRKAKVPSHDTISRFNRKLTPNVV